jgi:hypothetical protein
MIVSTRAFMIPRATSHLEVEPAYVKPLLVLKHNTNPDRTTHVQEVSFPAALPSAAKQRDVSVDFEAQRLATQYGVSMFRRVYPTDEAFQKAVEACQIAVMPGQEGAVPDMEKTPEQYVQEFLALNVPTLTKDKAETLVKAGITVDTIRQNDLRAVVAKTNLPQNLIRATIDALRNGVPALRGAPSAPSVMEVAASP